MTTLDTMGWDVVYATTFEKVNEGLHASGKLPTSFEGAESSSAGSLSGEWGNWNLVTGSPSDLVWMRCTVANGTLKTASGSADIGGSTWTVQFGLTLAQGNTPPGKGQTRSLGPTPSGAGAPRIVDHTAEGVPGVDHYVLMAIMEQILRDQVLALGRVFMSIVLNDTGSAPDQPWLVPTSAGFACESLPAGDPRVGVFALLAMTEGRSPSGKQLVVDRRVLDGAPEGTNAAFVIGPSLVTSQLLKPAVQGLVQGSCADDYSTDLTGTVVYNKGPMTWGAFTYDEGDGDTATVCPRIPTGNVQLALDGQVVHLSMSNINFPYPGWSGPGEITIAFDTQQFITFDFIVRTDGKVVMVPQTGKFNTFFNVTITPSEEVLIFQIALDATVQILMAVIGGVVESATEAVTEAAEQALQPTVDGGFAAEMDMIELENLAGNVDPEEVQQVEREAAGQAGDAVANGGTAGYVQKFKNAVIANKWKIFMKIITKMVTVPVGRTTDIAVWAAEQQFDKLPSLELFAAAGVRPVRWEDGSSFKMAGGSLQGALVIWGRVRSPA